MRIATFLAPVVALALAGCITVGQSFPAPPVTSIEIGTTTREDLTRMFGVPYRKGYDDGDRTWTWVHYDLTVFGKDLSRDLYVRFGPDGRVASYSFNSNFPEDEGVGER